MGYFTPEQRKRYAREGICTKCGRLLACPCCGVQWKEEVWRLNDGPCSDGRYYCVDCLTASRCACLIPPILGVNTSNPST